MTEKKEIRFKIVSAGCNPVKEQLVLALLKKGERQTFAYQVDRDMRVALSAHLGRSVNPTGTVEMTVSSVGLEDGSGESWYGVGYVDGKLVSYYYHSGRRTGCIIFK